MRDNVLYAVSVLGSTSVICVAAVSPQLTDVALIVLGLAALASTALAYPALSLAIVIKYLNPAIIVPSPSSTLLFWLVLICSTGRLLWHIRSESLRLLTPIWLFGLVAAILAPFVSPVPSVSILKAAMFTLSASAVVAGFQALDGGLINKLKVFMFGYVTSVAVLSAATLAVPSVAFALVDTSLQGIMNHPQSLGTFLAPFAAWILIEVLVRPGRPSLAESMFLLLIWSLMLMTLARTAAIAAGLGVVVALTIRLLSGRRLEHFAGKWRVIALACFGVCAAIVGFTAVEPLRNAATSFIFKREAERLDEAFYVSRGHGIQTQWNNFLAQPITGNGFGVYADGSFPDGLVEIGGIPVSAPVEKGFIPTAVLEETGLVGASLFWLIIVRLGRSTLRSHDLRWFAVFLAAVLVNVGEAVLLSPGGIGLHVWIVMGLSAALFRTDASRLQTDDASRVLPATRPRNLMT